MSGDSDVPQDLRESVQDAVGLQLKVCFLKKVNLEVKGDKLESRVLALAPHRVFLLSTRVPAKVDQSFSVFDIQSISSIRQKQLLVDYDRGQLSLRLASDQEVDDFIAQIGTNIQDICPGLNPLRVIKKLGLKPVERVTSLQTLWETYTPAEAGPCGGFSRLYWCVCDQMNMPYREEVQWDVDTIYLSQDTKELCLQDFIHLDNRDLLAITAALEFNQWFIKLSIKDFKLTADLCDQILRVVSRSNKLEELTLDNTGLKSDFAQRFAAALSQNPNSALHTIILANNCLEDKGVMALSSALSKRTPGLTHLDLSKNSLSAKGVNVLAQCFCSTSLKHLNLSGNTLRGDDMPNLWSFLSQPNCLHTLDLSNSECSIDLVCSALLRGSLKHLTVLNMSRSVFTYKRGKDFPSSFKQFFSSSSSLQSICVSGTKLPAEGLKALLLGLACNSNLRDVSLDISGCELRSAGSQILEGCIAEIPNITSLDVSDNGLDSDLSTLLVWLRKNRSIKHLSIGRNFSNIKAKYLGPVLVSLVHMIQEEDSPLASLSLADSRLKADLSVVLNALGGNSSLTRLDISGNSMGDLGAKMLAKALQVNTKLRTVLWDRNAVSAQGLQDVAAALEKNYTIRFMPVPITDAAQALKNSPEKTEDALMKMEQYLLRNHESRRYLQDQAFRLQQGLSTSATQQMMGQVCVQVQDQLNSLRFSSSERVQQDMKTAESLMRDAKSSTTLLRSLYAAGVSDGSAGVCIQQVQEKLCSVAGEISTLIDQQLQALLVSMLDSAQSVCPGVMQQKCLRADLLRSSEGRTSVSKTFITNTLLEQSAVDILNKTSEVKLSMATSLSDYITDEILQSLTRSQQTLAAHLNRRGQPPLLHHNSQEPEVTDEREIQTDNMIQPETEPQRTHKAKRKSIHSRMFRPMSSAFELDFDLCKALEGVSIFVDDLPLPPPLSPTPPLPPPETPLPVEAELPQIQPMRFSDVPTGDTPTLQHITKSRPRRTKRTKPSRAACQPISKAPAQEVEESGSVDQLDKGVPEFFSRKVTNFGVKPDTEKRESRLSGFFSLIKHRPSSKATPTSPTPRAMSIVEPEAPPPAPAVTFSDPVAAVTSSLPTPAVTFSDPVIAVTTSDPTPAVTFSDPAPTMTSSVPAASEPVAPEVKGHVQEAVKRGSPLSGRHMGVQVLGNDLLAEIRAKQEKRKKAGVSPSAAGQDEGDHGHTAAQRDAHEQESADNTHKPRPEHTPLPKHTLTPVQKHTPVQKYTPTLTPVQKHTPEHIPVQEHTPEQTLPHTPVQKHSPEQTHTPVQEHTPEQTHTPVQKYTPTLTPVQEHTPEQTLPHTPVQKHSPEQTHTPVQEHTPEQTHTPIHTPVQEHTPEQTHTPTHTLGQEHLASSERHTSGSSDLITPPPPPPPLDCVPESPALPAPPLSPWVELSVSEGAEPGPVTHSTEGGDSPDHILQSPSGSSVFDTHTLSRSISCVQPTSEDNSDRQRTQSLPSAAAANHIS
ncbi:F-actin-uncapping protein LRRC16A isoform X2 [Danio rerio]|uniref:F-actin-uncapping protein LRRC16A isoform X2 n=2 Tax=Danio rerio TaxID=7955 RepID=A0AC58HZJ1_DANRE|nr:CARMIL1 [Danio rerio]